MSPALGHRASGVAVVTADAGGRPVGMAVELSTSVSLVPPLVLLCLPASSATGRRILASGAFAVCLLGDGQRDLAERFAAPVPNRFGGLAYRIGAAGCPILRDATAFVECRIVDAPRRGDRHVVVGEIVDLGVPRRADPPVLLGTRAAPGPEG
jgi:flavin reductase (DIM6/NTAB) family NADH-FMN oxidoreductase RutF